MSVDVKFEAYKHIGPGNLIRNQVVGSKIKSKGNQGNTQAWAFLIHVY